MSYMLDTNICIYIIRQCPDNVLKKFRRLKPGDICLSSVTLSELQYGAEKSQHIQQNKSALKSFLLPLEILPYDFEAAVCYGHIRAALEKKGTPIGPLDTMIAAHAKSLGLTLVTNNKKEFERVPGLKTENWTKS